MPDDLTTRTAATLLRSLLLTPDWYSLASCRGYPLEWWYPDERETCASSQAQLALEICRGCSVQAPCADAGRLERHGLWGGLTPAERGHGRQRRRAA